MQRETIPVSKCRLCEHCFSIVPFEAVLCKKGIKKDIIIKRPKNNYPTARAKKVIATPNKQLKKNKPNIAKQ